MNIFIYIILVLFVIKFVLAVISKYREIKRDKKELQQKELQQVVVNDEVKKDDNN